MIWAILIFGAGVLGAAALPVYQESKRHPPALATPLAKLPQGDTYYRWFGPETGPVVVCVHGLSTPSIVFHELAQHLARLGYRVLVYDLYGRGTSANVSGLQTPAFFARHLHDLLDDQGIADDVTLVGYSMGGSICAHVAAETPDRFRKLILLAPAGMGEELGKMARWAAKWPVVGDWAFFLGYPKHMRAGLAKDADDQAKTAGILARQYAELDRRGFVGSVLSSLRGTLRSTQEHAHRRLANTDLPVTAIWGQQDTVIPLRALGTLTGWNPHVRHLVIDGAGHGLPHTHADEVAQSMTGGD